MSMMVSGTDFPYFLKTAKKSFANVRFTIINTDLLRMSEINISYLL